MNRCLRFYGVKATPEPHEPYTFLKVHVKTVSEQCRSCTGDHLVSGTARSCISSLMTRSTPKLCAQSSGCHSSATHRRPANPYICGKRCSRRVQRAHASRHATILSGERLLPVSTSGGRQSMERLSSKIAHSLVQHHVDVRVEADIAPDTQGTIAMVKGVSCAVLVSCKQRRELHSGAHDRGAEQGWGVRGKPPHELTPVHPWKAGVER